MHILHHLDEIRLADEIPELKGMQRVCLNSNELSLGKLLSSEHLDLSKYSDACVLIDMGQHSWRLW
jgi:hypothetical protein